MRFSTGYFCSDYSRSEATPPFRGTNFELHLGPDLPERGGAFDGRRLWPVREVLVEAESVEVAQRAANLVRLARSMIANEAPFEPLPVAPHVRGAERQGDTVGMSSFPLAMYVAAKTTLRARRVRALAKYGLSLELWSAPFIELDPGHAPFHLPRSVHPEDHVRLAYVVVLAYAAVEELGLEVRASASKPSFINGAWNPVVLSELEERLRRARIDTTEPVPLLQRGPLTTIDRQRATKSRRTRWRPTGRVGDGDVPVVDAINDLSFLRSRVSAHANAAIEKLSPYDAASAQLLVRRLFLESVGAWRMMFPPPKPRPKKVGSKGR